MSRSRSFSVAQPAGCPFKQLQLADIPGEWEDIPFGGDHSAHYNPSGMYKYSLSGNKTIDVFSAEATKDVLKLDAAGKGKASWTPQIRALLGESAFSLKYGSDHRRIRKVLNPLFTDSAIAARFDSIWSATDTFVEALFTKSAECAEGEYVSLHSVARRWAWDIGVSVVLGVDGILTKDENDRMHNLFGQWTMGMFDPDPSNLDRPGTFLGDGMIARKELLDVLDSIIDRGIALGDDLDRNSALHVMLKESTATNWTADELRDGLLNLLFATHDTTAVSTNNVVYAMYKHPVITQTLSAVLDELKRDKDGNFEYEELMECPYLDCFVKEALRFTPVVYGTYRTTLEDTIVNGTEIDKGQTMHLNLVLQSRNSDEFENPEEFNPSRWMNGNGPSKYGYTPFGMGSKICLGYKLVYVEMKLMVALFQSRVRMEIDDERVQKAMSAFNFWDIHGRFYPK